MKKIVLLLFIVASSFSFGQQYKTAVGVKGGYPGYGAFNIKHFLSTNSAIEGVVGGTKNTLYLQMLYEREQPLTSDFDWYWGLGGHLGFWSNGNSYYNQNNGKTYTGAWGGFDAVFGVEYTFVEVPINVALDFGPTVSLFPYVGFTGNGGLALRYAFQ